MQSSTLAPGSLAIILASSSLSASILVELWKESRAMRDRMLERLGARAVGATALSGVPASADQGTRFINSALSMMDGALQ